MIGADSETTQIYEEVRGAIASVISQVGNFIRMLIDKFVRFARQFYTWMAENPLSATLCIANFCVLLS